MDYKYRMSKNEITVQQQFEYVQAYWQYAPPEVRRTSSFIGYWIGTRGGNDNPQYYIIDGTENLPAAMSWRHAARFTNWLTNDKGSEQAAFENGAYDTSTFGYNDDGTLTDQAKHNPDAKFWLPTMDEYVKSMFWDPGKNNGEGGYWRYPHSKDIPPIPGLPSEGGETNTGIDGGVPYMDAGSYPWAGLLDGSGGEREWLEAVSADGIGRFWHGSEQYDLFYDTWNRIDTWSATIPDNVYGFRISSIVPSPGTMMVLASGFIFYHRRGRVK